MAFSEILKLHVPESFPLTEYEELVRITREVTDRQSEARREFNGAANLIGWRFKACVEYKEEYLELWHQGGADVPHEILYTRERVLFGMFVSGVSTIDSICYAAYAVASDPMVLGLAFDERLRRRLKPRDLREAVEATGRGRVLVAALAAMLTCDEWETWVQYRNTMAHRSNIHRVIRGALGGAPPPAQPLQFAGAWSHPEMDGDEDDLEALLRWLGNTTRELLSGATLLVRGE